MGLSKKKLVRLLTNGMVIFSITAYAQQTIEEVALLI